MDELALLKPHLCRLKLTGIMHPQSVTSLVDWFGKTDLSFILGLDGVTEERLLTAIDSLEEYDSDAIQQILFEAVKENYEITAEGIFYDVTNTYLYGKRCPLGKLGHSNKHVAERIAK